MGDPEPRETQPDPDDVALSAVDAHLQEDGYQGQFRALEGGELLCLTCRGTFPASSRRADQVSRIEGASDPADMLVVIPVVCPVCDASGSLVANYGPESSLEEAQVLRAMEREPAEGDDLDEPTPGITSDT